MFDEVDEGTAIYKVADKTPVGKHFVTYEGLPSDWYLRLTGAATRMIRGDVPLSRKIPAELPFPRSSPVKFAAIASLPPPSECVAGPCPPPRPLRSAWRRPVHPPHPPFARGESCSRKYLFPPLRRGGRGGLMKMIHFQR